jgi:hypothetical protein
MQVTYPEGSGVGDVILGPCPGCLLWQLDYTFAVASEWTRAIWHLVVERALEEHFADCAPLRELMDDLGVLM